MSPTLKPCFYRLQVKTTHSDACWFSVLLLFL